MIYSAVVSEISGKKYRVVLGSNISGLLPRMQTTHQNQLEPEIAVGDTVAVVFFGRGLANGLVLGRFEQ